MALQDPGGSVEHGVSVEDDAIYFEHVALRDHNFSGIKHKRWRVVESRFERCRFEGLRVEDFSFGSGRKMSEYVECSFDGSRIKALIPGRVRFIRCSFRNVRLRDWICRDAEFIDCVFSGNLSEINFDAKVWPSDQLQLGRDHNTYRGNDFSGAKLKGVAFKGGVNLLDQRLPQGEGYLLLEQAEPVIQEALARVLAWPSSEERHIAKTDLEIYLDYIREGQWQLLLSPHDFVSRKPTHDRAYRRLQEVIESVLAESGSRVDSNHAGEGGFSDVDRRVVRGHPFVYFRAPSATVAMRGMDWAGGPLAPGDDGEPAFDGVDARSVEPFIVLGHLVALVRRIGWRPDLVPSVSVSPPEPRPVTVEEYNSLPEDSPWKQDGFATLEELDTSVRDTLADAPDGWLPELAARWAQTDQLSRYGDVNRESLLPLVEDLVRLARRAREANEQLYCWSSPH